MSAGPRACKGVPMEAAGFLAIQLIVCLICAFAAMAIAASKGRSQVGWFFGGLLLGVTGIIIVACISNLKHDRALREQMESEQRRLREQLRQERIKAESYRQYSLTRIDVHDRILGVDTRSTAALPGGAGPLAALPSDSSPAGAPGRVLTPEEALAGMTAQDPPASPPVATPLAATPPPAGWPPAAAAPAPAPPFFSVAWYYEIGGKPVGPVAEHDVRRLLRERRIDGRTLLWCEDLGQWTSAMSVEIFRPEALS